MKRYRLKSPRAKFFAAVTIPAQEPALAVATMKDADGVERNATANEILTLTKGAIVVAHKSDYLTSAAQGHQHLLCTEGWDDTERTTGSTDYALSEGSDSSHSHPWIRREDGTIVIGEAEGHTHELGERAAEFVSPTADDDEAELASGTVETIAMSGEPGFYPDAVTKAAFSADQRRSYARSGVAMADGGYPIRNAKDLANAISDWGRAKAGKRKSVAAHIKRRAKALGLTSKLPTEGPLADALGTSKSATPPTTTEKKDTAMPITPEEEKELRALAEMTDAQKSHYRRLGAGERAAFIAKSARERQVDVEADKIVYTVKTGDAKGRIFRESDDQSIVTLFKRADEAEERFEVEKAAREGAEIATEAAQIFKHTKGKPDVIAKLFGAAKKIGEEAVEILKSGEAAAKFLASKSGINPERPAGAEKSAREKLDEKVEAFQSANKIATREEAKLLLLKSGDPEVVKLYDQIKADERAARAAHAN